MNLETLFSPLAASIVGGLIVALANHFLTTQRENQNRLAELRIGHTIKCWTQIERATNTANLNDPAELNRRNGELEDAIGGIMLLGSRQEVETAQRFVASFRGGRGESAAPLLKALRASLRSELGLGAVDGETSLRMDRAAI